MGDRIALLAAGGTGGHLFPAEALAHELIARGWRVHLASDSRAGRFSGTFPAEAVHAVSSATFGSKNPLALLRSGLAIWRGVRQASALIDRMKPDIAVGFGGYPTLPPVYAATRRRVPTLIHEQNAVMGRANKALSSRVKAIAGGFLAQEGPLADRIVVTGNPVRPEILDAAKTPYSAPLEREPFRLLVFGGSQGAQFFSQALPKAIECLGESERSRLLVSQQARAEDGDAVRSAYERLGIKAEVSPFFDDMAARLGQAHLVISRAGASTVSEIAVVGRPALLVPYPYALDHDQAANAASLAKVGGAEVHQQATLTPERLSGLLRSFMAAPERLVAMAAAARNMGKPDAAVLLADLTESIAAGIPIGRFKQGVRA